MTALCANSTITREPTRNTLAPNQQSHSLVQPQTILYRSEFIIQLGWENMSKERATIVAEQEREESHT